MRMRNDLDTLGGEQAGQDGTLAEHISMLLDMAGLGSGGEEGEEGEAGGA